MDAANETQTIAPQPKPKAIIDDDTTNGVDVGKKETLENSGDGNAVEISFLKLPLGTKEELVKGMVNKILRLMLDNLSEDEKEASLVRNFNELLPKLPCESQRAIEIKVKDVSSQSHGAFAIPSAPESPLALETLLPDVNAVEVIFHKLPLRAKEELVRDVSNEIVPSMLDNLSEDEKEAFLVRNFKGLFLMLPRESQREIDMELEALSYHFQQAFDIQRAMETYSPDQEPCYLRTCMETPESVLPRLRSPQTPGEQKYYEHIIFQTLQSTATPSVATAASSPDCLKGDKGKDGWEEC